MDDNQRCLLYLFERPFEPLNAPRANGMIQFQQTLDQDEAVSNPMVAMDKSSDTRFGSGAMIMNIPMMPNIVDQMEMVKKVPKGVPYSHFDPVHVEAVKELTQYFMDSEYLNKPNYWQYCGAVRESVNEGIFIFALSYAIITNPALDSRLVPAIYEVFPNAFIKQHTMVKSMDMVKHAMADDSDEPKIEPVIDVANFSGPYSNPEKRVAYWREDYGLNAHHWHWHLVFPFSVRRDIRDRRDRRGEIFYYMHNQMLARYDWERLSNGLARVVPLENWHDPIPDGYYPDLTHNNGSNHYTGRPDNMTLHKSDIDEIERLKEIFLADIENGYMIKDGGENIQLSDNVAHVEKRGIDYIGDALEPNELSVNFDRYGFLHGSGHISISEIHDPERNHEVERGVMAHSQTAMRDPVFHRWHKFVDDICQQYKKKQEPYEENDLMFDPVHLESVSVKSEEGEKNVLETGWTYHTIEVSRGLDFFNVTKPISIKSQHLTHKCFTYNIQVTNNQTDDVDVTVRLYMAPKFDEKGETMTFMEQRLLWAEMDRYHCTLKPDFNSLERLSTESSITILEDKTFRNIENDPRADSTEYCGCGLPQHLLLPKGTVDGMDFQIFALISEWDKDKVEGSGEKKTCSNAASYCGILDEKYPDARPMGYPFDRRPNSTVDEDTYTVSDFASALPNATMSDIKIVFKDENLCPE